MPHDDEDEVFLWKPEIAARKLQISRGLMYRLIATDAVEHRRLGRAVRVTARGLRALAGVLSDESEQEGAQ
jgi:hypothetical protein